jgi:hypothetical protein
MEMSEKKDKLGEDRVHLVDRYLMAKLDPEAEPPSAEEFKALGIDKKALDQMLGDKFKELSARQARINELLSRVKDSTPEKDEIYNEIVRENETLLEGLREIIGVLASREAGPTPGPLGKSRRPVDLFKGQPIERPIKMWVESHFTGTVLAAHTQPVEQWHYVQSISGFSLETKHGKAIIRNVGTVDALRNILDKLGPEALQYELAALCQIEEKERKKHGNLPEYNELTPTKISASDLLRAMGRKPDGGTFWRETQMRPWRSLVAASAIKYLDIVPTHKGKAKLRIGSVLNILNEELEATLPFDDIEPKEDEVISLIVMPGQAAWDMIRSGLAWCHPKLLKYHPIRHKYEIAIGFYLLQLQAVRRNKEGQDYVSLGTVERESGVEKFDGLDRRRLPRVEKALQKLAADGIIGGEDGRAIIEIDPQIKAGKLSMADSIRAKRLRLAVSEDLPALSGE